MGKGKKKQHTSERLSPSEKALQEGLRIIRNHSLFAYLLGWIEIRDKFRMGKHAGITDQGGHIYLNKDVQLSEKQWAFVIAHCLLHLAFGHFDAERMPRYQTEGADGISKRKTSVDPLLWNMACDIYIDRFLSEVKFGEPLCDEASLRAVGGSDELAVYERLLTLKSDKRPPHIYGTAAVGSMDMQGLNEPVIYEKGRENEYAKRFAECLYDSVSEAIGIAAGVETAGFGRERYSAPVLAARWFVGSYPLLGGLAASFEIVEDRAFCIRNEIEIAAIDIEERKIYVNPFQEKQYSEQEWRFVLAHEYLHAGLKHRERCQGRDFCLWNIACDFVINGWLCEMQVGAMPKDDLLYDPELKGMSAESIYDLLFQKLSRYEKLGTFRGYGKGDILPGDGGRIFLNGSDALSADDFCMEALQRGLSFCEGKGRGLIPAGLIEEIRALSMPPIPWDAALAEWFQEHFEPIERRRSYARPSRRQASTPDIPRPRCVPCEIPEHSRTFGVVVDTSGSMSAKEIGMALGSIASYSAAKEVPMARVVFCDAAAYDAGYLTPEDIAGRVEVKGRGGTMLQPAIDLLEGAKDFPKDGPILIITDGYIEDHLDIRHEHAYLLPKGMRLPFKPVGKVFYFAERN